MKIKIYTTGGSIDKVYSTQTSDFIVGEPTIGRVLSEANVNVDYEVVSLLRKDSLEITDTDRQMIVDTVRADSNQHILITHGTDTMIQTAKTLMPITGKVIVLTGAMQPAAFKVTDAVLNVGCALSAVQILPDGVYIAMSGRIFDPMRAHKNTDTDQFEESS